MQPAAVKPEITTNDLDKIDVRAGTILRVEDVRGSRKLVVLTVDFGDHRWLSGSRPSARIRRRSLANRLCLSSI